MSLSSYFPALFDPKSRNAHAISVDGMKKPPIPARSSTSYILLLASASFSLKPTDSFFSGGVGSKIVIVSVRVFHDYLYSALPISRCTSKTLFQTLGRIIDESSSQFWILTEPTIMIVEDIKCCVVSYDATFRYTYLICNRATFRPCCTIHRKMSLLFQKSV